MANTSNSDKWYFTKEQLEKTPSREKGFDAYKELQYRQQAANFIQDMGQRLKVAQLCINTAIVYMHRFYVFHSFTSFPWYQMAAAALFLAAKVEEQPRKLEYVIRVANICRNPKDTGFDINSDKYIAQSQDLVFNENVLLQTLGFDVAIDHPHTYVVRCCHLVRASKDLAQTSYFMASNSLHLTTMCIQYKPTVVACFCILLACKWSNWEIPLSNEKKEWFTYVDQTVTAELLEQLTNEFLVIFENCPSRLKEKIMSKQEHSASSSDKEQDKKIESSTAKSLDHKVDDHQKHRSSMAHEPSTSHRTHEQKERDYKEKKERERIAHMSGITLHHQTHHHRPERSYDVKNKPHTKQFPNGPHHPPNRNEPRDILREAAKEPTFGVTSDAVVAAAAAGGGGGGGGIRENVKDPLAMPRIDKDNSKREPLFKTSGPSDLPTLNNYPDISHQIEVKSKIDPSTKSLKSDQARKFEDHHKSHERSHDVENIKKHLFSGYDKNNAYIKPSTVTSQKIKQPFNLDNKSVPKASSSQSVPPFNVHYGSNNGSYNKPPHESEFLKKIEVPHNKEETAAVFKRPSLFSPEKSPPRHEKPDLSTSHIKLPLSSNITSLPPITNYPPTVNRSQKPLEPELRPTIKKIEQIEGFENLIRDNTVGVTNVHQPSSASGGQKSVAPSLKVDVKEEINSTSNSQSAVVNGLETNPTLISNLLKEAATISHLPGVASGSSTKTEPNEVDIKLAPAEHKEKEHHHHKSKKKKDKHKHRDKDKNKDEKKRKHKEKEKDKHKHKEKRPVEVPVVVSEPIKIKIQKDKIQPAADHSKGLKIKIAKDKIRPETFGESTAQSSSGGGLKIKITKDSISNCNASTISNSSGSTNTNLSTNQSHSSSRKRGTDQNLPETPAIKVSKSNYKDAKANGRHVNNKVAQSDCDSSLRRLAESKYSKGSS